jgi:hypothetical protein
MGPGMALSDGSDERGAIADKMDQSILSIPSILSRLWGRTNVQRKIGSG